MSSAATPGPRRAASDGRWEHDRLIDRVTSEAPLLVEWTKKDYNIRYRQSLLGLAWSVVQPLAILAIFGGIMAEVLHVSSDGLPYIAFAWAGLVPWTFISSALAVSVQSLLGALPIATKVYFPREVVPLAQVCASGIDLLIGTAILLGIILAQGIGLSYRLVALPIVDVILVVWVAAIAIMISTVAVFLRDLRFVVPLAMQLFFIGSPVMYSATLFPKRLAWINDVNPVAVLATATRDVALLHSWPHWSVLLPQGAAASLALVAALMYVRSVEPRLADVG